MKSVVSIKGRHQSGIETTPHIYKQGPGKGMYSVSKTRYVEDYIYCDTLDEIAAYVALGYKVRMSNPKQGITAPSGIVGDSLNIVLSAGKKKPTVYNLLPEIIKEVDNLDPVSQTKGRKEQNAIRALLVGLSENANCTICQNTFHSSQLVAAHIKRRSDCTNAEKLDIEHIATLMCKFGCDSLYENGFVSVDAGSVVDLRRRGVTRFMQKYIDGISGNSVANWTGSQKYYEWHFKKMGKS